MYHKFQIIYVQYAAVEPIKTLIFLWDEIPIDLKMKNDACANYFYFKNYLFLYLLLFVYTLY